jgi:hypothetical protein
MVQLFSDQLRDARAGRAAGALAITWIRTLTDLATSAVGEHLRKDRTMTHSLATFEPTRSMRLLGLVGLAGGILLLWAFVSFNPFHEGAANFVRLLVFSLGGAAIALAFYGRQATVSPILTLTVTGLVVISGVWYAAWLLLAENVDSPSSGTFGVINFVAGVSLWVSAAVYGAAMLKIGAAWRGMSKWGAVATRLGATVLIGSAVAWLGLDRLGLVGTVPYGHFLGDLAVIGVTLNGLGWTLLGAVLVFGGRRAARGDGSEARDA